MVPVLGDIYIIRSKQAEESLLRRWLSMLQTIFSIQLLTVQSK